MHKKSGTQPLYVVVKQRLFLVFEDDARYVFEW
jgi:hypothetical protein